MANRATAGRLSSATERLEAYVFDNDKLITANGEIDEAHLRRTARERAFFRYGNTATSLDIAFMTQRCRAIAEALRAKRREQLGIADTDQVLISPFGKIPDGLRRSAF